ncbi:MAG TPA: acetylornithine deacetylase [Virgibacillus sp.]|nr:acetylornithine deacetylase [Virgibacillus sp.]
MYEISDVMQQVDERTNELLELLENLIRFRTESPPARNTRQAQNFVADYLKSLGFTIDQWELYPGDDNVVGVQNGSDAKTHKSLLLNGHIDVVEVDSSERWVSNPFEPKIENGKIIGRGTADMKGGLAGSLFALKLLKEHEMKLGGDITFESVVGEEAGEAGTLECCRRGYTSDFAIVCDTSDNQIQGQGGVITGWITLKDNQIYHDGIRGQLLKDAPEANKNISTIEKMTAVIASLQQLEQQWVNTKFYRDIPTCTTTINPAVIKGGRNAAFIADECHLWITVHFLPHENYQEVTKEIEHFVTTTIKSDPWFKENPPIFTWGGQSMIEEEGEIFPPLELQKGSLGVETLAKHHQQIHKEQASIGMSSTVTDGGWLGEFGIDTAIYGPGKLEHAHQINEELSIADLVNFTKTMIATIYDWTNQPK